jgi:ribose transport system ATP-binding protein
MGEGAVIEMQGISKHFPGVQALQDVSFEVCRGEIHALVGENGAGKSTLMKILAGAVAADSGSILAHGEKVAFRRPIDAIRAGISTIYQELVLCPNLSIAANIFLGHEEAPAGFIREDVLRAKSREYLNLLGIDVDPATLVAALTTAQQQMVEIAKALSLESKVIIMDEPTAALSQAETDQLFQILRRLQEQDASIVYISHRLEEIFQIADRVTVLRDGRLIGTRAIGEVTAEELVRMMVGREIAEEMRRTEATSTDAGRRSETPALEVRHLTRAGVFEDIGFAVYPGEVLGFAGLIGAGRSEVMRVVFGIDRADSGTVLRSGEPVTITSPAEAIRHRIGMTTEDRKRDGLFANLTVRENASAADLGEFSSFGWIRRREEGSKVRDVVRRLDVRPPDIERLMVNLSGGNQQKVTVARWLLTDPEVLILDEPTRGVDVGSKVEIRNLIRRLAQDGKAVLVVSSELPELLGTADRIIVMRAGRMVGEFEAARTNQEEIMAAAATGAVTAPA